MFLQFLSIVSPNTYINKVAHTTEIHFINCLIYLNKNPKFLEFTYDFDNNTCDQKRKYFIDKICSSGFLRQNKKSTFPLVILKYTIRLSHAAWQAISYNIKDMSSLFPYSFIFWNLKMTINLNLWKKGSLQNLRSVCGSWHHYYIWRVWVINK